MVVGNTTERQLEGVDITLDSRHDIAETAARGTALIDMSHPVRLPEALR
ncbi:MAG: hypothetical protein M3N53_06070 [Actinomycetota bacterium]|nr:hypothetical protein [Actinomycetota bacterium]